MPALITPFDGQEQLKAETARQLIDFQLAEGVSGFYICGATGEGPALRPVTRMEMAETTVAHVAGRGWVIDHIGAPNMQDTLELVRHATRTGVDAVASLAPTNSYRYTTDELYSYYAAIAAATDLPVLVYATDMIRTQDVLGLMARLMQIPNVIGLKFTIRDYFLMGQVCELNKGDINVINGPDETLLCGLAMGADGGIGSTYNVMPGWFCSLYQAYQDGDLQKARMLQYKINHVIRILHQFSEGAITKAIKATLQLMGFDAGEAASPAKHIRAEERQAMREALREAGLDLS